MKVSAQLHSLLAALGETLLPSLFRLLAEYTPCVCRNFSAYCCFFFFVCVCWLSFKGHSLLLELPTILSHEAPFSNDGPSPSQGFNL